jgi:hypothetical protein
MDADRKSMCKLTLTSDRLQSKVEDRLLISGARNLNPVALTIFYLSDLKPVAVPKIHGHKNLYFFLIGPIASRP